MNRDPPFSPQTGNPEGHDYLDWYRHLLQTGQITEPPPKDEPSSASESPKPEKPDAT